MKGGRDLAYNKAVNEWHIEATKKRGNAVVSRPAVSTQRKIIK